MLSYQLMPSTLAVYPAYGSIVTTSTAPVGSCGEAIQVGSLQLGSRESTVVLLGHLTLVTTLFGACRVAHLRLLMVSIDNPRLRELVGAHTRFLSSRDLVILVNQEFQGCQQTFL